MAQRAAGPARITTASPVPRAIKFPSHGIPRQQVQETTPSRRATGRPVEQPVERRGDRDSRRLGIDWILIDTEHAPNETPMVADQLRAASMGSASPVVRPAWNDAVILKRRLDVGVQTLLVPFIQNAAEAARAVATRYPPRGMRGVASVHRANRAAGSDYFARSDGEICVLVHRLLAPAGRPRGGGSRRDRRASQPIRTTGRGPSTACLEMLTGHTDQAIEALRRSVELAREGRGSSRPRTPTSTRSATIRASSSWSPDDRRYESAHLDELERVPSFQDVTWLPIRRRFGIEAFGANAFEGDAGTLVIEEHDELVRVARTPAGAVRRPDRPRDVQRGGRGHGRAGRTVRPRHRIRCPWTW